MKIGKSGGTFAPHTGGVFAARCVSIVDLGTQPGGTYQGKPKAPQHKIDVGFITTELLSDGRPAMVKKRYTASLDEKASLRKDIDSWRGRKLTPAEIEAKFHIKQVLGAACMLNVVQEERDGKTYANIAGVMPLPAGMVAPAKPDTMTYFSLDEDEYEPAVFLALPDWAKKMIEGSPEYGRLHGSVSGAADLVQGGKPGAGEDISDDDVPW